jgi:hypothetical protein
MSGAHVYGSALGDASRAVTSKRRPTFYLGTHNPSWLARVRFPLCVSHRRLRRYRRLPTARCAWLLDSGAFSELSLHGGWAQTPERYVAAVRRYGQEIGRLAWAAPQDWMCEPGMLARTGLSMREHQRRTVANFVRLRKLAPELPIFPVIQGWRLDDYLRCVDAYGRVGVDLTTEPLVGVGSVCRRQATAEVGEIVGHLSSLGLRLHGFGIKADGLRRTGSRLTSADSMAWSFHGRYVQGCTHRSPTQRPIASEANCLAFARSWRRSLLHSLNHSAGTGGGQPI